MEVSGVFKSMTGPRNYLYPVGARPGDGKKVWRARRGGGEGGGQIHPSDIKQLPRGTGRQNAS